MSDKGVVEMRLRFEESRVPIIRYLLELPVILGALRVKFRGSDVT